LQAKKLVQRNLKNCRKKKKEPKLEKLKKPKEKTRREKDEQEIHERKQKQKEEAERQRQEEEELERLREERKKKEQEEYDALKGEFEVAGEGSMSHDKQFFEEQTEQLIEMVTQTKVIYLEDLAAKFNVPPQDIADKLMSLESQGRITGIIDERGKFIYITQQELNNIAKFINNRGRVSISEIAYESNKLVTLQK